MKSLILYSTLVGGFYAQNDRLAAAVSAARTRVGEDTWKRGFSGGEPGGSTQAAMSELRKAGIEPIQVEGELVHVAFVENRDNSGNTYPKLRIGLQFMDESMLLSLDLKGDVAQRLIVKLDNCQPGEYIRISAWPTVVTRGDRSYINHAASIKSADGKEIPVKADFSGDVKNLTDGVERTLMTAGISDKKVLATAKATRRIEAHKELLLRIAQRFSLAKETV